MMKLSLLIILLSLAGCCIPYESAHGETITKADILKTVQHIQQLAQEQKAQLDKAQSDYIAQGQELDKAKAVALEKTREAHDNAAQRDVILYAFAIAIGFYIGTLFGGEVMRNFPAPWSFVACAGVYIVSGIAAYTFGRIVLASLAHFIP